MGVINLQSIPRGNHMSTDNQMLSASSFTSALEELPGWSKADDSTLSATSDKDSDNGK